MMGAERKSMVMSDEEKRNTAYHEGGHALVALSVPSADPVHKATIIPRGRALGMVMQLPEGDRYSMNYEQMTSRLAIMMGGRVAEELIFGKDKVTSGASSDIQAATGLARNMVTRWGFSDALGTVSYGDNQEEVFLGHSVARTQNVSEDTAQMIDAEVRRLVQTGLGRGPPHPHRADRGPAHPGQGPARVRDPDRRRDHRRLKGVAPNRDDAEEAQAGPPRSPCPSPTPQPDRPAIRTGLGTGRLSAGHEPNRRPSVMGVVNVTPDSFSDGGRFRRARGRRDRSGPAADRRGRRHPRHRRRVHPAGRRAGLRGGRAGARRSTHRRHPRRERHPDLRRHHEAGRGPGRRGRRGDHVERRHRPGLAPDSLAVAAELGCEVVLMHMQGEPRTMQAEPRYDDVVAEVAAFLPPAPRRPWPPAWRASKIWLDPGIGFGKTAGPQPGPAGGPGPPSSPWASRSCWAPAARASSAPSIRRRGPADDRLGGSLAAALAGAGGRGRRRAGPRRPRDGPGPGRGGRASTRRRPWLRPLA